MVYEYGEILPIGYFPGQYIRDHKIGQQVHPKFVDAIHEATGKIEQVPTDGQGLCITQLVIQEEWVGDP